MLNSSNNLPELPRRQRRNLTAPAQTSTNLVNASNSLRCQATHLINSLSDSGDTVTARTPTDLIDALTGFVDTSYAYSAERNSVYFAQSRTQTGSHVTRARVADQGPYPGVESPAVTSLNQLLELHSDPNLEGRTPVAVCPCPAPSPIPDPSPDPGAHVTPSFAHRISTSLKNSIDEIRKRKTQKKLKIAAQQAPVPPEYIVSDFHHKQLQELRVVIENQEGLLEKFTDLLYKKDAEIDMLNYRILQATASPPGSSRGEGTGTRRSGTLTSIREVREE